MNIYLDKNIDNLFSTVKLSFKTGELNEFNSEELKSISLERYIVEK